MSDTALLRETLAVQRDSGVAVFDLEVLRITPQFALADWLGFLAVGQQLGARHILVAGDDPDRARLCASFASLCEAAQGHGLTADLEFMPWTAVPDLHAAIAVLAEVQQPNAGILVDALHFARSGSTLAQLAEVPPHWLHYAQICDGAVPGPATLEGMIFDARNERLLPGEGGTALKALFDALPPTLPISIEVPSVSRAAAMGDAAWVAQAWAATQRLMGEGL
jgi:sugar phosphate isomerase/epimerase